MGNSITSTAKMIEKMKSIADEKTKRFQEYMNAKWFEATYAERELCAAAFWQGLFNLQLEMLKAAEAEEVAAQSRPLFTAGDLERQDIDPMEAAAIDAGYIKDVRDFIPAAPVKVRVTNHYFYPQDIGEANEGDIWHDLDGRPHFILGDGWIEARGFMPNCAEGQRIECETAEGKFSKSTFPIKAGQWLRSISPSSNQIAKFKLT